LAVSRAAGRPEGHLGERGSALTGCRRSPGVGTAVWPGCKGGGRMSVDAHQLRDLLLQSDQEFRELAMKHHELDDRLHELSSRAFLSETEQIEEVQLKKRKLQLKDRMEGILQRHRVS
jgi:uncharacterized protein YdcH (DUF465 family)